MPFETYLLDAALARRREDNEKQRLAAVERVTQWLKSEGSRYGIDKAYLFGSVVRPYRFTERSDVDIAIERIEPDHFFEAMAALSEVLEREVDLVELSKCHFGDRIRQQGVLWTRRI